MKLHTMGLFLLAMASATAFGDELDRLRLAERCFVWRPHRCQKRHQIADERLVKSVTKGFSKPEAAAIITKRAWETLTKKDAPTALLRFNQALIVDKNSWEAWWGAGTAAAEMQLFEDAELCLAKASLLNPKESKIHYNVARLYASDNRDPKRALQAVNLAVAMDPKFIDALKLQALLLFQTDRFASAKASYDRAIGLGGVKDPEFEKRLTKAMEGRP